MTDEDLIGEPPPRKRGRPTKEEAARRANEDAQRIELTLRTSQLQKQGRSPLGDPMAVHRGVNVNWLIQAFRMDVKTVRRKLADLKPIGLGHRQSEIYDFAEAVRRLAKPPENAVIEFLKGARVSDLPIHLQDPFWSAKRKQQLFMRDAGDLWPTEAVMDVVGEAFKTIKSSMQLWVDNLEAQTGLTGEQRGLITTLVDGLQDDIYAKLCDMPKHRRTPSSAEDPEVVPSTPVADVPDEEEDLLG